MGANWHSFEETADLRKIAIRAKLSASLPVAALTGCVHGTLTPAQCVLDVRLKAIVAKRPATPNTATDANTCW
jgi:hypothetical protein